MIKMNRFFSVGILLIVVIVVGAMAFRSLGHLSVHSAKHAAKAVYYCPMHPNYTSDRPGTCPICNMSLVKRETSKPEAASSMPGMAMPDQAAPKVFTVAQLVAMKPGEICLLHKCKMGQCLVAMTPELARLGKCPHCGEDLGVIIKEAFPEGYTQVQLGAEKQPVIGVKTAPVQKLALTKTIRASGRIAYDPELYQAEEEYLQAAQALKKVETADPEIREQAEKLVDSAKIKLRLLGLSNAIVQEIEKAGKQDRSLLYSDAGGKVWLYASIYEYEMPFVREGDSVEIDVPAISDKKFQGIVRSLDSVVDPVTRSIRVRAQLENPDGVLKPGMFVNATLRSSLGEQVAVPEEAVFATGEKNIVFVVKENNVFEPREVALGAKADHFYQIKSGLQEGEQVVTSGNFLIDSESRLKAALQGAAGGEHSHG
ncbi:MAG: efflux RND transporter periplasmic adaptor subunit [Candidatus Omnitrophica bacterium]|nr:efflux RND transporter periplasmic adaptor subunit [Candidatus Omnitrophota bacterium]